jgi:hypothetical protein
MTPLLSGGWTGWVAGSGGLGFQSAAGAIGFGIGSVVGWACIGEGTAGWSRWARGS